MALPRSIITERLLIREWEAADAAALNESIARSHEHLVVFMPWAALPPLSLGQRVAWIETTRADEGAGRGYGLFLGDDIIVGSVGYHRRIGAGGLEIGYWVGVDHLDRGYATEAARALTHNGFGDPTIDRIEIHHDRANEASGRIPRGLGYDRITEAAQEITAPGESGITVVWRFTRDTFEKQWRSESATEVGADR